MIGSPSSALRSFSINSVLALVLASVQIALPLSGDLIVGMTVAVTLLLSCLTFTLALPVAGRVGAVAALVAVSIAGFAVEVIGVHSGVPFGRYAYTDRLQPQLGGVPLLIGLAWFSMALPAWSTAGWLVSTPKYRILVGGLLLAGWDLFLDPQMVDAGLWRWNQPGLAWQGIPLVNFAGWVVIAVGVMGLVFLLSKHLEMGDMRTLGLTALFAWMVAMSTLGFLMPFAFDRPTVGITGGVLVLPPSIVAFRRAQRSQ